MYVDLSDSIALAAGIIIVLFIAVMVHPEYLTALQTPFSADVPAAGTIPQIRIPVESNTRFSADTHHTNYFRISRFTVPHYLYRQTLFLSPVNAPGEHGDIRGLRTT